MELENGTSETHHRDALVVRDISKRFGATQALDRVSLSIARGEIHALCGGNGSGKSTLIKILAGVLEADSGDLNLNGVPYPGNQFSAVESHSEGIRVVHQNLGIFPDMSVAENLFLGHAWPRHATGTINRKLVIEEANALIDRFEIDANHDTPVAQLSPAMQTQLAIARALRDVGFEGEGLLILDEPTTALPKSEVESLFAALRRYAAMGTSILFVSHRIDEIMRLTDGVTVIKDGCVTGTWRTDDLTAEKLVSEIVGASVNEDFGSDVDYTTASTVLSVSDLNTGNGRYISFDVSDGEILGLAGLVGSGRTEILASIFGARASSGSIELDGVAYDRSNIRNTIREGIAMVPENRIQDAAFLDQSLSDNLAAPIFEAFRRYLSLSDKAMKATAQGLIQKFGVKAESPDSILSSLSGGNQQKVIIARWLQQNPRLLLLDEPTQGVDVGARADIYGLVRGAVENGAAALVVASDFEELALVSDRVLVISDGEIIGEIPKASISAARIAELVYGGKKDEE